jgi:DNA-binding LytR/AlgR family response regulator
MRFISPDRYGMPNRLHNPASQAHRSAIVNLSRIAAVEPLSRAKYTVILDDGTEVTCSRGYRSQLREKVFFSG